MMVPLLRNTFSMNLNVEVWSKVSEHTHRPALNGEITMAGTRNPSPTGPSTPPQSDGGPPAALSGELLVTYSPSRYPPAPAPEGRPARPVTAGPGVGGATWSKNPPF